MKILFVLNNYYVTGNGLCASARRTIKELKEAGHDVRVLSGNNSYPEGPQPEFCIPQTRIWLFDFMAKAQGYCFARHDRKVIEEAVNWADVIHLEEPFYLQMYTARTARRLGKPCTATYHLHPENILAAIAMNRCTWLGDWVVRFWRDQVFNFCTDVQCPTDNVRERLERLHFRARLHTISNGLILNKLPHIYPEDEASAPFTLVCIGRLAREKDQITLLRALRYCRNASRIQLKLAGRGPKKKQYQRLIDALVRDGVLQYTPTIDFLDYAGLMEMCRRADLFVHCANVEVEGLSCLEALQQEVVPVIASGKITATAQFALDERSVFPNGDARALAERIDYWIEHPAERREMARKYAEAMDNYDIRLSIDAMIRMFEQAIQEKR